MSSQSVCFDLCYSGFTVLQGPLGWSRFMLTSCFTFLVLDHWFYNASIVLTLQHTTLRSITLKAITSGIVTNFVLLPMSSNRNKICTLLNMKELFRQGVWLMTWLRGTGEWIRKAWWGKEGKDGRETVCGEKERKRVGWGGSVRQSSSRLRGVLVYNYHARTLFLPSRIIRLYIHRGGISMLGQGVVRGVGGGLAASRYM